MSERLILARSRRQGSVVASRSEALGGMDMTLSDLASLGSFVSGVAVVVSLVFVGFQLRQNTRAVVAGTSQSHAMNWAQLANQISGSADVARIWRLGLGGVEALSEDERVRFYTHANALFRFIEASRLQWRHKQLDNVHWQNIEAFLKDYASQRGIAQFWAVRRHMHSTEFRTWYEALPRSTRGLFDVPTDGGLGSGAGPAP